MKTIILAGGFGSRIRDVTNDIPKPMISIGNYPILWHIMKIYSYYNFNEFVLCLGYKSHTIKNYFLNYSKLQHDFQLDLLNKEALSLGDSCTENWKITFAETGLNALTGARVYRVKKYIGKDRYFGITYGDGVADINIEELFRFHKSHGRLMTVTGVHPPGRFGELKIDNTKVVGFNEKPQATEGWISGGFFICSNKVLDYFSSNEDLMLEKEPIEQITKAGELMVYKHEGFWHPMDTSREYQLLNSLWKNGKAPWKVW